MATISKKDIIEMNRTASGIKGVLDNLRVQLQILEEEIKADEKSKAEYERRLNQLEQQKEDITKRMAANAEWSKMYDSDIGPFANR
jgi:chromosome segregation ATPase